MIESPDKITDRLERMRVILADWHDGEHGTLAAHSDIEEIAGEFRSPYAELLLEQNTKLRQAHRELKAELIHCRTRLHGNHIASQQEVVDRDWPDFRVIPKPEPAPVGVARVDVWTASADHMPSANGYYLVHREGFPNEIATAYLVSGEWRDSLDDVITDQGCLKITSWMLAPPLPNLVREPNAAKSEPVHGEGALGPRMIAPGATIDPENITDKDCADLAACLEREHVKKVIREVYATLRASGFEEAYKHALVAGLDELSFRLLESWGEPNPHILEDENNEAPLQTPEGEGLLPLLREVAALWPDLRQLQDGFMNGDPNFTAWDHSVRDRCIALSFRLDAYSPKPLNPPPATFTPELKP